MEKSLWTLLLLTVSALTGLSQGPPPPNDPNDDPNLPPPAAASTNILELISTGGNYYAYLPTGQVDYQIQNLGSLEATLWIVTLKDDGSQQGRTVQIESGKTVAVQGEWLDSNARVYMVSLQNFRVTTSKPVKLVGPATNQLSIVKPETPLRLRRMETLSGQVITVGIDHENIAHYPVFGKVIGALDKDDRSIIMEDGAILEPPQR